MGESRLPTEETTRVGTLALRKLKQRPHVSQAEIRSLAGVSAATVKRAFEWLRDAGAIVEYIGRHRAWTLQNRDFSLPIADPDVEDLEAMLTASGLLRELGQRGPAERARALYNQLAQRLTKSAKGSFHPDALRVTQATGIVKNPKWVIVLLHACRRSVVRLRHNSAWRCEVTEHVVEPWQVWIHNGIIYLRGYSRTRNDTRTFGLASVEGVDVIENASPKQPVPSDVWESRDPRYGVDNDRPGEAMLRFRGHGARIMATARWHPAQRDTWVTQGELLERRLPYNSCRELARRIASVVDGVDSVEPEELRVEVLKLLRAGLATLQQSAPTAPPDFAPPLPHNNS